MSVSVGNKYTRVAFFTQFLPGNISASVTWKQSCQYHFLTIVPVLVGKNRVNVTWNEIKKCHLGTIFHCHFGTIV